MIERLAFWTRAARQFASFKQLRDQWFRLRLRRLQQSHNFHARNDKKLFLTFASAAAFTFKDHGIKEESLVPVKNGNGGIMTNQDFDDCARSETSSGWEQLYEETDLLVYRRRIKGPYEMYEYKCVGTYRDITPQTFLDAQNDLGYRREWDENIITLELLDENGDTELIRWVAKYPYPMYPREYVYVRKTSISTDEKIVVVDSQVVQPEVYPSANKKNVRVCSYRSQMVVRSHKGWNDKGVDYILTYSDNPEANIPRYVYNWIVNHGGPYFLRQVHKAAREIDTKGKKLRSSIEKALNNKHKHEQEVLSAEIIPEKKEEVEQKEEKEEKVKEEMIEVKKTEEENKENHDVECEKEKSVENK